MARITMVQALNLALRQEMNLRRRKAVNSQAGIPDEPDQLFIIRQGQIGINAALEQHPAAAAVLRQVIAAHQDRHASRDFAHRLEQWQSTVHLDCFIGNAGHT